MATSPSQTETDVELGTLQGDIVFLDKGSQTSSLDSASNKFVDARSAEDIDESYICPICFDTVTKSNHACPQVENCGHRACRECMLEYCAYNISIHKVPIPCPMMAVAVEKKTTNKFKFQSTAEAGCSSFLSANLVQDLLVSDDSCESNEQLWAKFNRLHLLSQDSKLVSCTRCGDVVSPSHTPPRGGQYCRNSRTCPECKHSFCSVHGDLHLGVSCLEHKRSQKSGQQEQGRDQQEDPNSSTNLQALHAASIKPCSHCGAHLQKIAGCDHVVCPACHKDMCFRCGTHRHLTGKVTRYCGYCQQGYLDHRYVWRIRLYYCLSLPFAVPVVIMYMAMLLVGVVASAFCCACFGCGRMLLVARQGQPPDRRWDPVRGIGYVGLILVLPLVLMLYDVGFHGNWVDEFVQWFIGEEPFGDGSPTNTRPTRQTSESEPRRGSAASVNSNGNDMELREIPTLSLSYSTSP